MLAALIAALLLLQALLAFAIFHFKDHFKFKHTFVAVLFLILLAWTFTLNDSAWLLKHAPNKFAVVVYDLFPLFVTAILALLTAARPKNILRYGVYGALWLVMNGYFFGAAIYSPIHCGNTWMGFCCMQTDPRTCGAAAAATLLKINGINATEDDMKRACLTSQNGTSFWGLYHGLRERADPAGKSVIVDDSSCDEFLARNQPALVWVMLTRATNARDKRYSERWGWDVNVSHAVVFLGSTPDGNIRMADPKAGVEKWGVEALRALWQNKVIYVQSRARQ